MHLFDQRRRVARRNRSQRPHGARRARGEEEAGRGVHPGQVDQHIRIAGRQRARVRRVGCDGISRNAARDETSGQRRARESALPAQTIDHRRIGRSQRPHASCTVAQADANNGASGAGTSHARRTAAPPVRTGQPDGTGSGSAAHIAACVAASSVARAGSCAWTARIIRRSASISSRCQVRTRSASDQRRRVVRRRLGRDQREQGRRQRRPLSARSCATRSSRNASRGACSSAARQRRRIGRQQRKVGISDSS